MSQWTRVAYVEDIPVNQLTRFCVDKQDVIVYRTEDTFHVYANRCTHIAVPLSEGYLLNDTVVCRLHGAKYDLRTGACLKAPGRNDLYAYRTNVDDGALYIDCAEQQMIPPPCITVKSRSVVHRRVAPGVDMRHESLVTQ